VIGTWNFIDGFGVEQLSLNQVPYWQPQLLSVTVTLLSTRPPAARVMPSPNALKLYASTPTLGMLPTLAGA
jgi:hypothetical protein